MCTHKRISFGVLKDLCNDCGLTVISQNHIDIQTNIKIKNKYQLLRNKFFNL